MELDQLAAAVAERFGGTATTEESFGALTIDVPQESWVEALRVARDEFGCDFFDWLSAVDERESGFAIVVHLYSLERGHHLLVRTRVSRESPVLASAVPIYRGANWHERETYEMFGIQFTGHPDLKPLLLPDGFEGHPLRKDFVLAARVVKPWPGAKEPGESGHGAPSRRRMRPPGVPDDWGQAARTDRAIARDRASGGSGVSGASGETARDVKRGAGGQDD